MVTSTSCELTVAQKVVLAAAGLDESNRSPFSAEDLVVAAWQTCTKTFGLKGYSDQYPDSNKVLSSVMGERGLVKRGLLIKMGEKLYAITKYGRKEAARLTGVTENEGQDGGMVVLSRDKDKFLQFLFTSTVVQKFENDDKHGITFSDACRFWNITNNLSGEDVKQQLRSVEQQLNDLDLALAQNNAELRSGRIVTAGDLRVLHNIHNHISDRFDRVLDLLQRRPKRRKGA